MIIVGTGHRPPKITFKGQNAYQGICFEALQSFLVIQLKKYKKIHGIISGMALGFDQALAEAGIELGIPVIAAVPCYGQESLWNIRDQVRYARLIKKSKKVILVTNKNYNKYAMLRRNKWMVNKLGVKDILLALHDGSEGGTFNCIRYATGKKKTIVNLWDRWLQYGKV